MLSYIQTLFINNYEERKRKENERFKDLMVDERFIGQLGLHAICNKCRGSSISSCECVRRRYRKSITNDDIENFKFLYEKFKGDMDKIRNYKKKIEEESEIKLLLIGNTQVGKTLLMQKFSKNEIKSISPTIGIDFNKVDFIHNNINKTFKIWDPSGQERFRTIIYSFISNSPIIIVVCDINNENVLNNIKYWYDNINKYSSNKNLIYIIGNINNNNRILSYDEILKYTNELNDVTYFELDIFNSDCNVILEHILNRYVEMNEINTDIQITKARKFVPAIMH